MNSLVPDRSAFSRTLHVMVPLPIFVLLLSIHISQAGSATWNLNPTSGNWNAATNWTPATVPNGPLDTATFALSNRMTIFVSAATEVNAMVFDPGASVFTIMAKYPGLTISGTGITNNSGVTQNLVVDADSGTIIFKNGANAGNLTVFVNNGATTGSLGGWTYFFDTSNAGSSTFISNPTTALGGSPGRVLFLGNSSAGNGTFTNNGDRETTDDGSTGFFENSSASDATFINDGGYIQFFGNATAENGTFTIKGGSAAHFNSFVSFADTSTADNATFTLNGGTIIGERGGFLQFMGTSDAGNATAIARGAVGDGGAIFFYERATGGTARFAVFSNGTLDISPRLAAGVTIGSLEGDGFIFLGARNLSVGSNARDTTFAGVIQDGGDGGGSGGSLTKIGNGKLTLTGGNSYTGGTIVNGGILLVNNTSGSGTGSGSVVALAGMLGGSGVIAGAVVVGAGNGAGVILGPGERGLSPGTLTILKRLTLKADATYRVALNSSIQAADQVTAKGVTIRGAQILLNDFASGALPPGTVFTVINNTAATPISGTFANLADDSTVVAGSNTFQADYQGGDGNDLTLTVVP